MLCLAFKRFHFSRTLYQKLKKISGGVRRKLTVFKNATYRAHPGNGEQGRSHGSVDD